MVLFRSNQSQMEARGWLPGCPLLQISARQRLSQGLLEYRLRLRPILGRVRILLADDHPMICAGFQKLLEPQYEVVGSVGDGRTLLNTAAELKPDVVLLDIGMPLLNGLDAGRELKRRMPDTKLIFL